MQLTMTTRINREIDRLKKIGEPFCPADVGKRLGTDARQVISNIRDRQDIYQLKRCDATKRVYRHSLWGFREVSA